MADGLLLVNKPVGITSFDVIRTLRRATGVKKIGHAGTLDPLASGLMIVLFGQACKQAQNFSKLKKSYHATIALGFNSTTGDGEGVKSPISARVPTSSEITTALAVLTGEIEQTPSMYSAIKVNGQEAYKRVRAGEQVVMPSRKVTVYRAEIANYQYPSIEVDYSVSSGTYIRSLAEDLGRLLTTGAYLSALVRVDVGSYRLADALDLDSITEGSLDDSLRNV
ncbi:MAG TPA: tRNA pseudouridine(55) synthase TruB [Candidatus Saccharimonadia bacterium]|nr:tRNA pseudouridine(55) synthase TruB [Candidatus Saccharimonadia bacterium]